MYCHARKVIQCNRTTSNAECSYDSNCTAVELLLTACGYHHRTRYWSTCVLCIPNTNTYLCCAAVLYAEKNVQVTCEPEHCMTTFLVQHPENFFFTLFTPFCTIPFSEHTIVSMIVIFVCAVECLFVVSQLVEKWHEEMKVCVFGRLGTRMCTAQSLPQYYSVLQW